MMIDKNVIIRTIKIDRPPVFLCGPYVCADVENDRRNILKEYIIAHFGEKQKEKYVFQPKPIIVDEIFASDTLKRHQLNLSLLEELVASLSFKTYIFLDTISTSMELGLFSHNSTDNQINVLIPYNTSENYEKRTSIGEFVKESIQSFPSNKVNLIEYTAVIDGKGFTHFKDDSPSLPNEIIDQLNKDIIDLKEFHSHLEIVYRHDNGIPSKMQNVFFQAEKDEISFTLHYKTLFYFINSLTNNYKEFSKTVVTRDLIESSKVALVDLLLNGLIYSKSDLSDNRKAYFLLKKPQVTIKTRFHHSFDDIIRHTLHLIQLVENHDNSQKNRGVLALDRFYLNSGFYRDKKPTINDLLGLTNKDKKLMTSYKKSGSKYIMHHTLKREFRRDKHIVTYSSNKYGQKLKDFHRRINAIIQDIYSYPEACQAYGKGMSIKKCLTQHINHDSFVKLDITHFFESITRSNLEQILRALVDNDPRTIYKNFLAIKSNRLSKIKVSPKVEYGNLKEIINTCMYKRKLPIGFITSPLLSNLYLSFFDQNRKLETRCKVTRYSDDILISSKIDNKPHLQWVEYQLKDELKAHGLILNNYKRISKTLKLEGDSIKFLGINIVKTAKVENRLTISDQYIRNVCKECTDYKKRPNNPSFWRLLGKVHHIKNISEDSYNKLQKLYFIKTNKQFDLSNFK